MNLRNWSAGHTKGLLIGLLSPLVFIPVVIMILAWAQSFDFSLYWDKFTGNQIVRSKVVSLSIISNLIWFYFFINKEKYPYGMGIILGTICYLPYILYVNFFA